MVLNYVDLLHMSQVCWRRRLRGRAGGPELKVKVKGQEARSRQVQQVKTRMTSPSVREISRLPSNTIAR